MPKIIIRARQVREGDLHRELPGVPEQCDHVAWIEGENIDDYEKNTGRCDAEAIGFLLIEISRRHALPLVVAGVVLEDVEGPITAEGRELSEEELADHPRIRIGGEREGGPPDVWPVTINGRPHFARRAALSYKEIEDITGTSRPTVTFREGGGRGGSVLPGEVLSLSEGMRINAVSTDNA